MWTITPPRCWRPISAGAANRDRCCGRIGRACRNGVNDFLWSQRPAFWTVPNEGPFAHIYVLGDLEAISFAAQSQADYALEIGPYRMKGPGAAGMDMLAAAWMLLGLASALWIAVHQARYQPGLHWVMRLAWPLWAIMAGPLGILTYWLAYRWPVLRHGEMNMWDRPLWPPAEAGGVGHHVGGGTPKPCSSSGVAPP